jgi:hypothetical protein
VLILYVEQPSDEVDQENVGENPGMAPPGGFEKRPIGDQEEAVQADQPVGSSHPTQARQGNEVVNDPDAIDQLQDMFPALDRESLTEFYSMCGGDMERTINLIGQQMNMLGEGDFVEQTESQQTQRNQPGQLNDQEEHAPGVSPDDVEFNLLAGNQFDPNLISNEERKMIEQALRESEGPEERVARPAREAAGHVQNQPQNASNVSSQRLRHGISEHEQEMENIAESEGLHRNKKASRAVDEVEKNKGNK